ncbi:hypothetical protein T310_10285 [Rasamsonia emersonii CBS 393.64]|uniref:Uncharacterized protein n=1 Tax=Rasamsonia emersonii (strain ATCC 16479 / CBS 393.64 / IMI 116815) TaxID=1408163 RepID=A0A0F4YEU0_RASE3|nr:hypothetical protein T310_10285 [Rasamsonia emersonii CBS 393.64]KKA16138.1 hypothetical protein T310_10285 [Rasamsonia emersonii CBS 393.64]
MHTDRYGSALFTAGTGRRISPVGGEPLANCRITHTEKMTAVNTNLVARWHPLALGHQRRGLLVDLGLSGGNLVLYRKAHQHPRETGKPAIPSRCKATYHSEFIEGSGSLNVLQSLLQVGQLGLNLALSLLGALQSLGLKGLDSLELAVQIVGGRLEVLEVVLDLIDDLLVFQDLAVVVEVDRLGLLRQHLDLAASIVVALLESLQRRSRLAAKAQRAGHLGPVDLQSGATL